MTSEADMEKKKALMNGLYDQADAIRDEIFSIEKIPGRYILSRFEDIALITVAWFASLTMFFWTWILMLEVFLFDLPANGYTVFRCVIVIFMPILFYIVMDRLHRKHTLSYMWFIVLGELKRTRKESGMTDWRDSRNWASWDWKKDAKDNPLLPDAERRARIEWGEKE